MAIADDAIAGLPISGTAGPTPVGPGTCTVCCCGCISEASFCTETPNTQHVIAPISGFTDGSFNCSRWNLSTNWDLCFSNAQTGDLACYTQDNAPLKVCWNYCTNGMSISTGTVYNPTLTDYGCNPATDWGVWVLNFCNDTCGAGGLCCAQYAACWTQPDVSVNPCDQKTWTLNFLRYWNPYTKTTCASFCGAVPSTLTVQRDDPLLGCGLCTCDNASTPPNCNPPDYTTTNGPPGRVGNKFVGTITASNQPTLFRVGDTITMIYGSDPVFTSSWVGSYSSPSFGTLKFITNPSVSLSFTMYMNLTITGCPEGSISAGQVPPDYLVGGRTCANAATAYCCGPFEAIFNVNWTTGGTTLCGFTNITMTLHVVEG